MNYSQGEFLAMYRSLSALSVNLSAACFTAAFITPNFSLGTSQDWVAILLGYLSFGVFFLYISYQLERRSV